MNMDRLNRNSLGLIGGDKIADIAAVLNSPSTAIPSPGTWGDRLSPPSLSHKMPGHIACSEVIVIPTCGHLSNIERPVEFEAVHGFVARHPGLAT
jgi:pimeloyl-ACP methyl ester carboxylesterase